MMQQLKQDTTISIQVFECVTRAMILKVLYFYCAYYEACQYASYYVIPLWYFSIRQALVAIDFFPLP